MYNYKGVTILTIGVAVLIRRRGKEVWYLYLHSEHIIQGNCGKWAWQRGTTNGIALVHIRTL